MKKEQSIIDISWPITGGMTAYKDRRIVRITATKTWEKDHVRESLITLGSHSGTHVDAPAHFLSDGKSIDQLPVAPVIGRCQVLDLTHVADAITAADLKNKSIQKDAIILFKTKNSERAPTEFFDASFVYLAADGAQVLAAAGVRAVGIDYLGIERSQPGHETHELLLACEIFIIEGLRLGTVAAGDYFLCCLPLSLPGLEAAPARAVLFPPSYLAEQRHT